MGTPGRRIVLRGPSRVSRPSEAWAWASIAPQRAGTELAHLLDDVDAQAFVLAPSDTRPVVARTDAGCRARPWCGRPAALRCYADASGRPRPPRRGRCTSLRNHLSPVGRTSGSHDLLAFARPSEVEQ